MAGFRRAKPHRAKLREIGWREWIALPDLDIPKLKAKIDTGARTTALHAIDLNVFNKGEAEWVEFHVPFSGLPKEHRFTAQVIDEREIKNTSGQKERRIIIQSTLVLGKRHWRIELSLANREKMEFEVILGRTALRRHGFLINPGRSYLVGDPELITAKPDTDPEAGLLRTLKFQHPELRVSERKQK